MKKTLLLFLIFFLASCAHQTPKDNHPENDDDVVSVKAALDQAQASYLLGCVEAMKELKVPVSFPGCRDRSIVHRRELDQIMEQDI